MTDSGPDHNLHDVTVFGREGLMGPVIMVKHHSDVTNRLIGTVMKAKVDERGIELEVRLSPGVSFDEVEKVLHAIDVALNGDWP